ncbi:MAG TPA: oxygen-independent coproporphyrinogen III oxidase [Hyphomicrobiaceae bacterium]|nr:oxygen-independent coproporphyrinogen III oxidase [Hyphomicrobiaceae bacterium]
MVDRPSPEMIRRYAAPVPRYTSYPTANHFSDKVGAADYADWLSALDPGTRLSLYLHIPFCTSLCWYCACSTRATERYQPVADYLEALKVETGLVASLLPPHGIESIHWGGGSPDIVAPDDIRRLGGLLRERFSIVDGVEVAVEIDPRLLDPAKVDAFAAIGTTRVSLGVQDFDPEVQAAIGREQSFEVTRRAVEAFRDEGVRSVNVDLVYGLPKQTVASVLQTLDRVEELAPDRIAIFGYAHLPTRMKNQRLIEERYLPGVLERFELANAVTERLVAAGYVQVGIDHFARPSDSMASGPVARNFQGYTTDRAEALIGLGATAIGRMPSGYVQNSVATHEYARRVRSGQLATARGSRLSADDRMRAYVIERLMCDLVFSADELKTRFGAVANPLVETARRLVRDDADGLVEPTRDGFRLTPIGRTFARSVCAQFDAYLGQSQAKHSLAV